MTPEHLATLHSKAQLLKLGRLQLRKAATATLMMALSTSKPKAQMPAVTFHSVRLGVYSTIS